MTSAVPAVSYSSRAAALGARVPARRRSMLAFVFCAASACVAAGAATAQDPAPVSPLCADADVRLVTLIEAHGDAQDMPAEVLAQAFFTVMKARKACNRGEVEAALALYDSTPLGVVTAGGE
jgi:hypothetical protein